MQVVEHGHRAAGCERAGAVDDIALEDEPEPGPVVGEGALPVGAEQPHEPVDAGARPAVERLEPGRERVPIGHLQVSPDLLGRRLPDAAQLLVELRPARHRRRGEKVGDGGAGRPEREQGVDVDAVEPRARRDGPWLVQRAGRRVGHRAQAEDGFPQRRVREPRSREPIDGQVEPEPPAHDGRAPPRRCMSGETRNGRGSFYRRANTRAAGRNGTRMIAMAPRRQTRLARPRPGPRLEADAPRRR